MAGTTEYGNESNINKKGEKKTETGLPRPGRHHILDLMLLDTNVTMTM